MQLSVRFLQHSLGWFIRALRSGSPAGGWLQWQGPPLISGKQTRGQMNSDLYEELSQMARTSLHHRHHSVAIVKMIWRGDCIWKWCWFRDLSTDDMLPIPTQPAPLTERLMSRCGGIWCGCDRMVLHEFMRTQLDPRQYCCISNYSQATQI